MNKPLSIANIGKNWSEDEKTLFESALNFIRKMAADRAVPVLSIPFEQFLDNGRLVTDEAELARIFCDWHERGAAPVEGWEEDEARTTEEILTEQEPVLRSMLNRTLDGERQRMLQEAEQSARNAEQHATAWNTALKVAHNARTKAQGLEHRKEEVTRKVLDGLRPVLEARFWCDPIVKGDSIYLASRPEIVIALRRKLPGSSEYFLDVTRNLGRVVLQLTVGEMLSATVLPYKGNRQVDGFFHPHVDRAGQLCWGTAVQTVTQSMSSFDVETLCTTAQSILLTYCEENPHKDILAFEMVMPGQDKNNPARAQNFQFQDPRQKPPHLFPRKKPGTKIGPGDFCSEGVCKDCDAERNGFVVSNDAQFFIETALTEPATAVVPGMPVPIPQAALQGPPQL